MKSLIASVLLTSCVMAVAQASASIERSDTVHVVGPTRLSDTSGIRPVIGWQAFKSMLVYPKEAKRARKGCSLVFNSHVDRSGSVARIDLYASSADTSFFQVVDRALRSTNWVCSGKRSFTFEIQMIFVPRLENQPIAIVVEGDPTAYVGHQSEDSSSEHVHFTRAQSRPDSVYAIYPIRSAAISRSTTNPRPLIGWDSLVHRFLYPGSAKDAGFQTAVLVQLYCDSAGNPYQVSMQPEYPMLDRIEWILRFTPWLPATDSGRPISGSVFIPVFLVLRNGPELRLLIEGD